MGNRNTPIRVLHPITRLIIGGAQENTLYTAELLDPRRYHVEVVSGPQTGSEGSLIDEARRRKIALIILPDLLRQISPFHDLKALWKLTRMIRDGKFDIVHTHSSKAGILGRIAARLAGTPIIVHTVHGWSFHDNMSPLIRNMYILLERWAASITDAIIVVSARDIQKGLQAGIGKPKSYHLIRSAIPLNEFNPQSIDRSEAKIALGIPPDAIVIGNVGRFSPQKNPLDWVKIAGQVGRRCLEVYFLLVGGGPLQKEVEKQLICEGIFERTILTGLRRDIPNMMSAMDIFMLTSLWEGLPRVIPQAMAMGLPVLANRIDGSIEAVKDGETGFLCQPGDLYQMAERCIQLIREPQLRERLGQRGRAIAAQEYSLEKMLNQIDDLYLHLLNRHKHNFSSY